MTSSDDESLDPGSIPVVCEGVEITNLDIGPEEGFLISRIDGRTDLESLSYSTGMGRDKTMRLIRELREKNVIVFHGGDEKDTPSQETGEVEIEEDLYELPDLKEILKKPLPKGAEFRRIVDSVFVNLENLSYYELLNLERDARSAKIKKAYLQRTKLFHPDRYYRQADKQFKGKLQEIFKQLNKGYRELLDPEIRREYDLKLEDEEEEVMVAPVSPTSRSRGVKGSQASRQRADKQAKLGITTTRLGRKPGLSRGTKLKLNLEGGKSSSPIKKQVEKMKKEGGRASSEQGQKFYNWALQERDRRNLKGAKTNLELALQYEPGNTQYKKLKEDMEKEEEAHQAEDEFKAGQDAQAEGNLSGALRHYKEALNLGYESAKLYYRMAELSMELDANYERARSMALKAIDMESGIPEYHLCLARAYKGLGQKQAASVQLEKVLKLDPKNKIASKELKNLKRG